MVNIRIKANLKLIFFAILTTFYPCILFAQQKLYWTDASSSAPAIRCVDTSGNSCLDTANPSNSVLINLTPSVDYPLGIVIDETNGKIIFANGSTIERCNLDGTGREVIVTGQNTATHMAIDPVAGRIYWTSFDGIRYSNLDGTNLTTISGITDYSFQGIGINIAASRLIWLTGFTFSPKNLRVADLTNFTLDSISTTGATESTYGMAVDESNSRTYWAQFDENGTYTNLVYYQGVSAGNSITNAINGLNGPNYFGYNGAAIDYPETNIYFGNKSDNGGTIYRSSLSSPSQQSFLTGVGDIQMLAFSCGKYAPDSDGDMSANCREECPADPLKTEAGVCGCGVADTDTDVDSTPDCNDECPDDEFKTIPGQCGCGAEEPKDSCGCGLVEDVNSDGKVVCVKSRQLAPNTKIEEPPLVTVDENDVTIILEKFTKPTLTLKKKKKKKAASITAFSFYDYAVEIKSKGLKVAYDVQVSKVGGTKRDIKKITSKRNELTVKDLAPGNYNVKYRAVITQNNQPVAKTKYSPDANFVIQ